MSGSGGDGVRVNIDADASGFVDNTDKAARAAANLSAAAADLGNAVSRVSSSFGATSTDFSNIVGSMLKAGASVGEVAKFLGMSERAVLGYTTSLKQLTPEVLGTGSSMGAMAAAILKATEAQRTLQQSAAEVSTTMGERMRAAAATTGTAVEQMGRAFNASGQSAQDFLVKLEIGRWREFAALIDPAQRAIGGLGSALKQAAGAATDLDTKAASLAQSMAQDRVAAETSGASMQALAASFGDFTTKGHDAAASAEFFARSLNPAPLTIMRTLFNGTAKEVEAMRASLVRVTTAAEDAAAEQAKVSYALDFSGRAARRAAESYAAFLAQNRPVTEASEALRVKLLAATNAVMQFGLDLNTTSRGSLQFNIGVKNAADSAKVFEEALNGVQAPLQKLRTLMAEEVPAAADATVQATGRAGRGSSMMTMEFIRLGHEAVVGNWTRIPGTLMVVAEYSDTVRTALANMVTSFTAMQFAGVGAVLAVAGAFVIMIERAHAATVAINEATSAATMQGRSPSEARAQMVAFGAQMKDTGIMGATAMTQVASSISQLGELTEAQKSKIAGVGTALFLNWQSDAKKTGSELAQIFASTGSLDSYLVKEHLLSLEQQQAWAKATTAAEKYDIGIAAITARLGPLNAQIKAAGDEAKLNVAIAQMTPEGGGAVIGKGNFDVPKHLGDFEPGTKQADPGAVADTQAVIDLTKHNTELLLLKERLAAAERVLASATAANNAEQIKSATTAKANAIAEIEQWKAIGDASINAKQQADLAQILANRTAAGGAAKAMTEDLHKLTMEYWDAEAAKSDQTDAAITREKTAAMTARRQLSESQNRVDSEYIQQIAQQATAAGNKALTEADRLHKGRTAMTEAATAAELAVYQKAAADMSRTGHAADLERQEMDQRASRLHMMLLKEDASAESAAAKKSLGDKLSALSADQAAVHDNFNAVMAIEAQKIALLQAAGTSATKLLNEELIRERTLRREHAALVAADRQRDDAKKRGEDSQEIAQNKAMLDEQVAEGQLTKIQAIALERSFAAQKHAIELETMEATLKTLGDETEARKQQLRIMGLLKQQWATEDAKLNRAAVLDFKSQWDKIIAPVESAMSQQISTVLRGNATMGQAVRGFAASVVLSYIDMAAKKVFTEVSSQAMATAAHALGFSQRAAIGAAETASGNSDLIIRLGRWIATQLGLTAATGAGATARAGVLTAEQLAAVTATGVTARLSIAAAAAVAAAWAFADSASLGPPGLIAAPGVAAGAYAEVMVFQAAVPALAVGAWNVPKDMGANLHAGEMVIPASFAEGMRNAGSGGGSAQTLNYQPTINGGSADPASMRAQAGMIKSYLWHATRNGALRLPGR